VSKASVLKSPDLRAVLSLGQPHPQAAVQRSPWLPLRPLHREGERNPSPELLAPCSTATCSASSVRHTLRPPQPGWGGEEAAHQPWSPAGPKRQRRTPAPPHARCPSLRPPPLVLEGRPRLLGCLHTHESLLPSGPWEHSTSDPPQARHQEAAGRALGSRGQGARLQHPAPIPPEESPACLPCACAARPAGHAPTDHHFQRRLLLSLPRPRAPEDYGTSDKLGPGERGVEWGHGG